MKVKVKIEAVIDTERIPPCNKQVRTAIEKAAFNKDKNILAELWAESEIKNQACGKEITLEVL